MTEIAVNPDIRAKHTVHFERLVAEINKRDTGNLDHNYFVVKAALESGILVGAKPEDVDEMKTGLITTLANKAVDAFLEELKPVNDPN